MNKLEKILQIITFTFLIATVVSQVAYIIFQTTK